MIPLIWSTPQPRRSLVAGTAWWGTAEGSHYRVNSGLIAEGDCPAGWTNCDGRHLYVVVPGPHAFDLMGRAGNCGSKDDTEHRCWIVHIDGDDLATLTVDKNGLTCSAGAGSLLTYGRGDSPGWHGFVRGGALVDC